MSSTEGGGLRNASVNHQSRSLPQPSPPVGRRLRLAVRGCPPGSGCGRGSGSRAPTTAAPCSSQARSLPASRHSAFLIAGLTKMRSTCGSEAAALMTAKWPGVHTFGSTSRRLSATTMVADISSRSARVSSRVRHRRQPDVGVEADLMARMAGDHRAAARLRHVADQEAGPVRSWRPWRPSRLEESDQVRMAPVAVARQPHHLPGRAVDRQRRRRRRDSRWRRSRRRAPAPVVGCDLAAEQFLGRRLGIVRMGERRQRLRVERALVLRATPLAVARRVAARAVIARLRKDVRIESTTPSQPRLGAKQPRVRGGILPPNGCSAGEPRRHGRCARLRRSRTDGAADADAPDPCPDLRFRLGLHAAVAGAREPGAGRRIHGKERAPEGARLLAGRHHRGRADRLARRPDRARRTTRAADIAGNFEGQARQIFHLIDQTLNKAGGGVANLVTMTVFINDPRNGDRLTEIRKEIFPGRQLSRQRADHGVELRRAGHADRDPGRRRDRRPLLAVRTRALPQWPAR